MTYVKDLNESDAAKLINTTIRLRGVCYSRYNMKRQLRVPWLAVSSLADVVVEKPSPEQPKEVSIASLAQFNSGGCYGNLVKVSGVVTLQKPDGTLFIQNEGYGLCVQLAQPARLAPGDLVIVSGYSAPVASFENVTKTEPLQECHFLVCFRSSLTWSSAWRRA